MVVYFIKGIYLILLNKIQNECKKNEGYYMGIGRKVLVLNITLAIVSVLLVFIVGRQIWNTSYLTLEQNDVHDNTNRAYQAWEEEVEVLGSFVSDWAPWDETYAFATKPWDSEFEKKI